MQSCDFMFVLCTYDVSTVISSENSSMPVSTCNLNLLDPTKNWFVVGTLVELTGHWLSLPSKHWNEWCSRAVHSFSVKYDILKMWWNAILDSWLVTVSDLTILDLESRNDRFFEWRSVFIFSGGRRCPAKSMAEMSSFLFLTCLLHQFSFSLKPGDKIPSVEPVGSSFAPRPFSLVVKRRSDSENDLLLEWSSMIIFEYLKRNHRW